MPEITLNIDRAVLKVNAGRARSMDRITSALFELMKAKPYADISITEICKSAGVARKTFYRNFESKTAIIAQKIDAVFLSFARNYDFARMGARGIYRFCYEYLYDNRAVALGMLDPDLFKLIVQKIRECVEIVLGSTFHNSVSFDPALSEYYLEFAAVGVATVMRAWVQNGCKTPAKTMATLTERLLSGVIA